MTIAQREQQIHRVKASSFPPELDEALEQALRSAVVEAVKITLEAALEEEVKVETRQNDSRATSTLRLFPAGTRSAVWTPQGLAGAQIART